MNKYVNKTYNELDVSVTLQRRDFCDIEIALLHTYETSGNENFLRIHEEIFALLQKFDDENFELYELANDLLI